MMPGVRDCMDCPAQQAVGVWGMEPPFWFRCSACWADWNAFMDGAS